MGALTPVHLCRFAVRSLQALGRGFSWRRRVSVFPRGEPRSQPSPRCKRPGFSPRGSLQEGTHHVQWVCGAYLSASSRLSTDLERGWNFDQLSIGCARRLPLRTALPYDDQRCVGNLELPASRILTWIVATHPGILSSLRSTRLYRRTSLQRECSPTTLAFARIRGIGGVLEPRLLSVRNPSTSELLRTL